MISDRFSEPRSEHLDGILSLPYGPNFNLSISIQFLSFLDATIDLALRQRGERDQETELSPFCWKPKIGGCSDAAALLKERDARARSQEHHRSCPFKVPVSNCIRPDRD